MAISKLQDRRRVVNLVNRYDFRDLTLTQSPPVALTVIRNLAITFSLPNIGSNRHFLKTALIIDFISSMANLYPNKIRRKYIIFLRTDIYAIFLFFFQKKLTYVYSII